MFPLLADGGWRTKAPHISLWPEPFKGKTSFPRSRTGCPAVAQSESQPQKWVKKQRSFPKASTLSICWVPNEANNISSQAEQEGESLNALRQERRSA